MSKMSLMSRSKFGSSSTFIDYSEVLFSSTAGSHVLLSSPVTEEVTMMMQNRCDHRLTEEVTMTMRINRSFRFHYLKGIGWSTCAMYSLEFSTMMFSIVAIKYAFTCVTDNLSSFRFRCHRNYKQIKQRKKIKTKIQKA